MYMWNGGLPSKTQFIEKNESRKTNSSKQECHRSNSIIKLMQVNKSVTTVERILLDHGHQTPNLEGHSVCRDLRFPFKGLGTRCADPLGKINHSC